MNEKVKEELLQGFNELWQSNERYGKAVVKRYEENTITHETYRDWDNQYNAKRITLLQMKSVILRALRESDPLKYYESDWSAEEFNTSKI